MKKTGNIGSKTYNIIDILQAQTRFQRKQDARRYIAEHAFDFVNLFLALIAIFISIVALLK